jgi:hypothetical protein
MIYVFVALLILSALACGSAKVPSEPKAAVSPITLSSDLSTIDVCQAIPQEDMEAVMGRKLADEPQSFGYYDESDTSGCWYDGGKDSSGEAYYGYVVFTPIEVYNNQPLYLNEDVSGIGQAAYFNNGADTRQLWVKVNDETAFVVAFGDRANEDSEKAIARLVMAAIQ